MRSPRTRSSSVLPCVMRSLEPNRARPLTLPLLASIPSVARKAWLLPAPDSPTTATHSPRRTSSEKSLTAATSPSGVLNRTFSSSSRSTQSAAKPCTRSAVTGIERIAQPIANEIETHQQRHEKKSRHEQHPRGGLHFLRAIVDQAAQARERLLYPKSKEAQD